MQPFEFWQLTQHEFNELAKATIEKRSEENRGTWEEIRGIAWYTERLSREKRMPRWEKFVPHTIVPERTKEEMAADHAAALERHGYGSDGRKAR